MASLIGQGRHDENTKRREATGDNRPRLSVKEDKLGALGEVCFASALGRKIKLEEMVIPWQEFNTRKHEVADVGEWEVKTIFNPNYNLVCEASGLYNEKLDRKYVLIYLDLPNKTFEIKGWIYGYQFKDTSISQLKPARGPKQPEHYIVYTRNLNPFTKDDCDDEPNTQVNPVSNIQSYQN